MFAGAAFADVCARDRREKERERRQKVFFLFEINNLGPVRRMGVESLPVLIMGPESEKATTELANVSGTELADGG